MSEILKNFHRSQYLSLPYPDIIYITSFSEQSVEILRRFGPIWKNDGQGGKWLEGMQVILPPYTVQHIAIWEYPVEDYYWLASFVNRIKALKLDNGDPAFGSPLTPV